MSLKFSLILGVCLLGTLVKADITKLTSCKAQLDDGRLIDLSSLDRSQSPRLIF